MESKYQYLDIAVSCTDAAGSAVHHSFHGAPIISLPSLRDIATHFESLSEGYLTWEVGGKRSFTYFELVPQQMVPRMLITLRMDSDLLMSGRQIVNMLSAVKHRITDGDSITDELLESLTADAGFPDEPRRCEWGNTVNENATGVCCRTYSTASELSNIFGFPRQSVYEPFKAVLVVSATQTLHSDSQMAVINEPLDKSLLVVCGDGVTSSAYRVDLNDHLTLTYTRSGFDPQEVTFEVGTTNRFVHISGPALVVNSADHAGIVFRKRIPFTVKSMTGAPIDTYTILINERTANRSEEGFEISNLDFTADGTAKLTVQSTNYSSFEMEFTPESIAEQIPLDIELEPESREVYLRLDFGDGRNFEVSIQLEKNTKEYSNLRAGNFHGFRAHRLMGTSPETYNVDVRSLGDTAPIPAAVPVNAIPADERVTIEYEAPRLPLDEPETTAPVPPSIEKAPSAIWEHKTHERRAPEFANETIPTSGQDTDAEEPTEKKRGRRFYVGIGIIVVVLAVIVLWLFGSSSEDAPEESAETVNTETETPAVAATSGGTTMISETPAADADEVSDASYMNETSDWKRSELKSDSYRQLFDAFAAGDMDAITSHPYFTTAGRCDNKRALQVADMLWAAMGTPTAKSNQRALSNMKIGDHIDLRAVVKAIERYQPSEPNPSPRPGAPAPTSDTAEKAAKKDLH